MKGFVGETQISLLTGVDQEIQNLNNTFSGLSTQVYSLNDSGLSVDQGTLCLIGIGNVIDVILDNGVSIKCGEDQMFVLRNGETKKAKLLAPRDALMPLYRRVSDKVKSLGYELTYDPINNKEVVTHRVVGHKKYLDNYPKAGYIIHHKNFNKLDNHPNNLELMDASSHHRYHTNLGTTFGFKVLWQDPEYRKMMIDLVSRSAKDMWKNQSPEARDKMVESSRKVMNRNWADEEFKARAAQRMKDLSIGWWKDDEYRNSQIIRIREAMKELWKDEEYRNFQSERMKELWKNEEYRKREINRIKVRMNTPEAKARSSKQFSKNIKKKWQEEEFRTMMTEKVRTRMTPDFHAYLQEKKNRKFDDATASRGISIDTIKSAILDMDGPSIRKLSLHFECTLPTIRRVLSNNGILKPDHAEWVRSYKNHSVISVTSCEPDYLFSLNFDLDTKFAVSEVFVVS